MARSAQIAELEGLLQYTFQNSRNLGRALTHSSLVCEQNLGNGAGAPELPDKTAATNRSTAGPEKDNEQLEFLGDAVLGLVAAEGLFRAYPDLQEGDLTRMRAHLVSRAHLGKVAVGMNLGAYLRLGRGEERSGGRQKSVLLANALEAVIAALYLDGGLVAAAKFVQTWIVKPYLAELRGELDAGQAMGDHKSALQEWLQAHKAASPQYEVKAESGPDHRKRFLVEVKISDKGGAILAGTGSGGTKKRAEQEAARKVLRILKAGGVEALEDVAHAKFTAEATVQGDG